MRISYLFSLGLIVISGCGGLSSKNTSNTSGGNQANANAPPSSPTVQTVTIDSADGVILVGTLFEAAKPNSPAVLLLHQWQSDRHSYDDFAKGMQARGFSVLSIDGRGFGESTKRANSSAVTAERTDEAVKAMLGDVGAAFEFLRKQKNVDPAKVGIVGASYGSSLALIYAADNPKVAAEALLSPGLNYFGNMKTEPAIRKYGDRPLLMVAAEDDPDSAGAVRSLATAGNNAKYIEKIYPRGGHGTGLFGLNEQPGLPETLESFFVDRFGLST